MKKITINTLAKHMRNGNFEFTLTNHKTGWEDVFKVAKVEPYQGLLVSRKRRKRSGFYYIGRLDGTWLKRTPGSKVPEDSYVFKSFRWLMTLVHKRVELPKHMEVSFKVKCPDCGHMLSDPKSVNNGVGGTCLAKRGLHTLHA